MPDDVKHLVDEIKRLQMASRTHVPPQQLEQRLHLHAASSKEDESQQQPMTVPDASDTKSDSGESLQSLFSRKRRAEERYIQEQVSDYSSPITPNKSTVT